MMAAGERASLPTHAHTDSAGPPLRVLLANDRLGYGNQRLHGAGRLMVDWTRALVERGLEVTAVILRDPGALGDRVLDQGLPFVFSSFHAEGRGTVTGEMPLDGDVVSFDE